MLKNISRHYPAWLRRTGIEILGWLLIVVGLVALVLPGPGLLTVAAGLVVLALRYPWAKRLLIPIKHRAVFLARKSAQSWYSVTISVAGGFSLIAVGITWGLRPRTPSWWPLDEWLWLPGGWHTGGTLIASGAFAVAVVIYSWRRYRTL